jgi:hypothetical protein
MFMYSPGMEIALQHKPGNDPAVVINGIIAIKI